MRNTLIQLLFLSFCFHSNGQSYYSKTYDPFVHKQENIRNIIIDDTIIYASCRGICDNDVECFKLAKFDLEGNYMEGYEDSRFETGFGFEHDAEFLYVDGGNEPNNDKLIANRISKNGLQNDTLQFSQDSSKYLINISSISNTSHFVIYGTYDDLSNSFEGKPFNVAITKWINKKDFTLDKTVTIPVKKRFTTVQDATSDDEDNLYFSCIEKLDVNGYEGNYTRIVKYSSSGELLWDYIYPFWRPTGASPPNLCIIDDKILFEGYNSDNKEMIACLDLSGKILWETELEPSGFRRSISVLRLKPSIDNNLLLCGYQRAGLHFWIRTGFIIKIDVSTGEFLWQRLYDIDRGLDFYWGPKTAKYSELYDIDQLPNGDIIAVGSIDNSYVDAEGLIDIDQDLWLLRVDKDGCMEPGCGLVQNIKSGVILKDSCKWLEDNPVWHYTPWSPDRKEALHTIEVVRDTIIGNRVCSILGVTEDGRFIKESELIVFFELENEKVFFYEDQQWKKLFDFEQTVFPGDTLEYFIPQNFKYYDISSSRGTFTPSKKPYYHRYIDHEQRRIDNEWYKTIITTNIPNEDGECFDMRTITDHIGGKNGFLGRSCSQLSEGQEEYFRCYHSDTLVYTDVEECQLTPVHKYELGAKWTYEFNCIIPNQVSFVTYEIIDTLTFKNMPCYVINHDTICTEGRRVYAIDRTLTNELQLLFDYDEPSRFSFECKPRNLPLETHTIPITNKTEETLPDGQSINVTYVDTFCGYGYIGPIDAKIYEGIGSNTIQPFTCLDFCNEIADPVTCEIGRLRCFENSSEHFRFVDYPCDTVWTVTNTEDFRDVNYRIFPNPTTDFLYFTNIPPNSTVQVLDIVGKVVLSQNLGQENVIDIGHLAPGQYIVRVTHGQRQHVELIGKI